MYQRSRNRTQSQEWDPMRDEYEESTFAPQYQDNDTNAENGVQLDHCKLYVRNISKALNQEGLKTVFAKYGNCLKVFLSNDPTKRYALVTYETPSEAKLAMMKLNRTDPLQLHINVAHKSNRDSQSQRNKYNAREDSNSYREEDGNSSGKARYSRKQDEFSIGENNNMEDFIGDEDLGIDEGLDTNLVLEMEELKLKHLKLQEAQIQCKQRMILLNRMGKNAAQKPTINRCMLPDGRIVVRNNVDRLDRQDVAFNSAAGDSRALACSCDISPWNEPTTDSSTPSTCVLCHVDTDKTAKSLDSDTYETSATTKYIDVSKTSNHCNKFTNISIDRSTNKSTNKSTSKSDYTLRRDDRDVKLVKQSLTCNVDCNECDETDRLIQLRNLDYMDIVEDDLKIVIVLSDYPTSIMRLKHMEKFQRSINDVIEMQLKAGLLKKTPTFLDYYLNRGAIVCICKDVDARNWVVRIFPGLQERMKDKLVLLKAKVKKLCLGVIKTPKSCWPVSVQEMFKLLQYFNPTLKTHLWEIFSQSILDGVEVTSFVIDKVSSEIMRGASFKNIIDYEQMDFELTGNSEVYYDRYLTDMDEDLSSVASRVKLLQELKSTETTPRNIPETEDDNENSFNDANNDSSEVINKRESTFEINKMAEYEPKSSEADKVLDITVTKYILEDQCNIQNQADNSITDKTNSHVKEIELIDASTSTVALSEKTESVAESTDILTMRNSNLNIDSSRGIAYHRRTNYLHVEDELKTSIVLDGYPDNKLEGSHIRRLKHLFKDYLHKDIKSQRFANMIIPKFHDVYLSNGAIIYICDSLKTREYLKELLPKFSNATGLKLTFRDVKNLVRYTRLIMKLPQELSNVESHDILYALKLKYPKLNPDCWKYYSDIAGKQKRQFGVDPESLEVIKSSNFEPIYENKTLNFRIIDRQKRETDYINDTEYDKKLKVLLQNMYSPIDPDIMNVPLTRIRTNHYSDLIADDLKLYIGPVDYPETRIDDAQFQSIKTTMEKIVLENIDCYDLIPKFHDIYLFDGVIFIICLDMKSRLWVEENVQNINSKLQINLKVTEFRGAVGIISMIVRTTKDTEEVISILQKQNPRLRTKFWRKISTVQTRTKLDVVLQIDKLSAQIITDENFNGTIGGYDVEFKLGHLQSLLKPKMSLQELIKAKNSTANPVEAPKNILAEKSNGQFNSKNIIEEKLNSLNSCSDKENDENSHITDNSSRESDVFYYTDLDKKSDRNSVKSYGINELDYCKIIMKVPTNILPESNDGIEVILDLLEEKNPGLNVDLWKVERISQYNRGKFIISVDNESAAIIKGKQFDPTLCGEKLKFLF